MANLITRRSFIKGSTLAAVMTSFASVPLFVQRALAEGNIGTNGKKVLFIFLRGANDGLNNIVPIQDPGYYTARPVRALDPNMMMVENIGIDKDPMVTYDTATGTAEVVAAGYPYGIRLGNGFAAMHPALYRLSSVFNDGDLALIHRVAYPSQNRSHFDSQNYWETGLPNNNTVREGIFYRAMAEAIAASPVVANKALTGVSCQTQLPLMLRGQLPMTNLSSIDRYNLLGVYSTDRAKHTNAVGTAYQQLHPDKDNRDLIYGLGQKFKQTLDTFQDPVFLGNNYFAADNITPLFSSTTGFSGNIKTATQILAQTDAIVTGTQLDGFDTHTGQGGATGQQANLLGSVGRAIWGIQQYFKRYGKGGTEPVAGAKAGWNDVIVVTMSEFGRTTDQNDSLGTDHAEASVMFVAGGSVNHGVYMCDPGANAVTGQPSWTPCSAAGVKDGSMYNASGRYLKRAVDYRSVFGEIIRKHLGASDAQLGRIIVGYATESSQHLRYGVAAGSGVSTPIAGELGLLPGV